MGQRELPFFASNIKSCLSCSGNFSITNDAASAQNVGVGTPTLLPENCVRAWGKPF